MPAQATVGILRAVLALDKKKFDKDLKGVPRQVAKIGKSLTTLGGNLTKAITVPMTIATAVIAKFTLEFQTQMNRVNGLTGATRKQFKALEETALKLGATTQFSATEAADAMAFLAQAGFEVEEIMSAIGPTMELAAAGMLDMATAGDIVTNVMQGFGIDASETSKAVDVLAEVATSSNVNLVQLGEAMKFVAPTAALLGISMQETASAIGLLGNAGVQGSIAGTRLNQALLKLIRPSALAAETIKRLGVNVRDSNGDFKTMADILQSFKDSGASIQDIFNIFEIRGGGAMSILLGQVEELKASTEAAFGASGKAAEIAKKNMDRLVGAWKLFTSAMTNLALKFGSELSPVLEAVLESFREMAKWTGDITVSHKRLALAMGLVFSIAGPMAFAIGVATTAIIAFGISLSAIAWPITIIAAVTAGITAIGGALLKVKFDRMASDTARATRELEGLEKVLGSKAFAVLQKDEFAGFRAGVTRGDLKTMKDFAAAAAEANATSTEMTSSVDVRSGFSPLQELLLGSGIALNKFMAEARLIGPVLGQSADFATDKVKLLEDQIRSIKLNAGDLADDPIVLGFVDDLLDDLKFANLESVMASIGVSVGELATATESVGKTDFEKTLDVYRRQLIDFGLSAANTNVVLAPLIAQMGAFTDASDADKASKLFDTINASISEFSVKTEQLGMSGFDVVLDNFRRMLIGVGVSAADADAKLAPLRETIDDFINKTEIEKVTESYDEFIKTLNGMEQTKGMTSVEKSTFKIREQLELWAPALKLTEAQISSLTSRFADASEQIAKTGKTIGDALKGTFDQMITGFLEGNRELNALEMFADAGKAIFADMFSDWITQKLTFELDFSNNILNSRGGPLGTLVKFGKSAFEILKGVFGGVGNWISSLFSLGGMPSSGEASTGVFRRAAKGGVVMGPQFTLLGEAGPEAVIPLDQIGNLGVGGSGSIINVYSPDTPARVERSSNSEGAEIIDVIIDQAVNRVSTDFAKGGPVSKSFELAYGSRRSGGPQ